jgi:hypothetical protein
MKIFYLTTLLLSLGIAANAQTEKGTVNINGQFGNNSGGRYSTISNGLVKSFSMQLNPNVGYFIKNNWEVGAGVLLGTTRAHYTTVFPDAMHKERSNRFGLQTYSKYYFGKASIKPYITVEAAHTWLSGKLTLGDGTTRAFNSEKWNAGGGAGVVWFVSPKIGLFSQLTYNRDLKQIKHSEGSLNLNFGVQVNLGRKK